MKSGALHVLTALLVVILCIYTFVSVLDAYDKEDQDILAREMLKIDNHEKEGP